MTRLPRAVIIAVACVVLVAQYGCSPTVAPTETSAGGQITSVGDGDASFARAFADRARGVELEGQGTVSKLLPDDTDGARHQRFIVRLDSGQTVLISHNIDIAPRVDSLRVGDSVSFKGEFEWNALGGLMHWTHHDPGGSHVAGWIRHEGRTYQ